MKQLLFEAGYSSASDSDDYEPTPHRADKVWESVYLPHDDLLLGTRSVTFDLLSFHPEPALAFKLWQTYIERVDPLLKVTHVPTMQARVIEAIGSLNKLSRPTEALLFAVYCMAMRSISVEECEAQLGQRRDDLMKRYQHACQHALISAGVYRTMDLDCLTAFFLYLVSRRPDIDPRSLNASVGLAVRLAERMSLHDEATNAAHTPFEAERRRRLWWSLMLYNQRVCMMVDCRAAMLTPTWTCKVPANVNDGDLRPAMTRAPTPVIGATDAWFLVSRCVIADWARYCRFHIKYVNAALLPLARDPAESSPPGTSELAPLEALLEESFFAHVDLDNPLQYMTLWGARASLLEFQLRERDARLTSFPDFALLGTTSTKHASFRRHYTTVHQISTPAHTETSAAPSAAGPISPHGNPTAAPSTTSPASTASTPTSATIPATPTPTLLMTLINYDTRLLSTPATLPFRWHIHGQYPIPAVLHLAVALRMRHEHRLDPPSSSAAVSGQQAPTTPAWVPQAWAVLSENMTLREHFLQQVSDRVVKVFFEVLVRAWKGGKMVVGEQGTANEMEAAKSGVAEDEEEEPAVVRLIRERMERTSIHGQQDPGQGQTQGHGVPQILKHGQKEQRGPPPPTPAPPTDGFGRTEQQAQQQPSHGLGGEKTDPIAGSMYLQDPSTAQIHTFGATPGLGGASEVPGGGFPVVTGPETMDTNWPYDEDFPMDLSLDDLNWPGMLDWNAYGGWGG